jgi:hypothetical protein
VEQRDFEQTWKIWPSCSDWNSFENFQQKSRKIQFKIHENFFRSNVCVFMILVRASHVIQGRPTKNCSMDCIEENHHFFCDSLVFRSLENCRPFLGHCLPKPERKCPEFSMIFRIFVGVFFLDASGWNSEKSWKHPEKNQPRKFSTVQTFSSFFTDFF